VKSLCHVVAVTIFVFGLTVVGADNGYAEYPEKPIRIVVPYSPGGTSDTLTRIISQFLEKEIGQSVVIININGAGGALGWAKAKDAKPDGYTLTCYSPAMALLEAIKSANFTQNDFEPIAMVGNVYLTVTTKAGGKYQTLGEYKAAAESNPGKVTLAMGRGTLSQFVAAMVADAMGVELNLINAGGGAEKKTAVLGGHVDAIIEPTPGVLPMAKAGQLKVLAVLAPERQVFAPDIPTAREQGADVIAPFTQGLLAPKGTPKDRLDVISAALKRVTENPAFQEKAATVSLIVKYGDSVKFIETLSDVRKDILSTGKKLGY
jgi:tripartite-type tricarboxylate transporter receptor subunit TctC